MARRVLFSCLGAYGHANPLLPLARAFGGAGWEVSFVTSPDFCDELGRRGFVARPAGPPMRQLESTFLAARPEVASLPIAERLLAVLGGFFVDVAAGSRIEEQLAVTAELDPALVVHDACELSAPIAAAKLGVVRVAHGVTIVVPTPQMLTTMADPVSRLLQAVHLEGEPADLLGGIYLDIRPPSLSLVDAGAFAEVVPIRPFAASGAQGAPARGSLGGDEVLVHPRTVHVTLGTVVNTVPGLLETIVEGARQLPVNLVVTVGPDRDPGELGPQPVSVVVERYLPYDELLPRCDAVVSHAGAGTLLATLAHGLPSLLVPVEAEQQLNALVAVQAGVAAALPASSASAEVVAGQLERLLGDEVLAERARAVGEEIAAMPPPEEVLARLAPPAGT